MNKIKLFCAIAISLVPMIAVGAYKCTKPDGLIVYQQVQCDEGDQKEIGSTNNHSNAKGESEIKMHLAIVKGLFKGSR